MDLAKYLIRAGQAACGTREHAAASLGHVLLMTEAHGRQVLADFERHYNAHRPHGPEISAPLTPPGSPGPHLRLAQRPEALRAALEDNLVSLELPQLPWLGLVNCAAGASAQPAGLSA
ncbi:hypothetical protein [Streptomyces sp. NPDC054804]